MWGLFKVKEIKHQGVKATILILFFIMSLLPLAHAELETEQDYIDFLAKVVDLSKTIDSSDIEDIKDLKKFEFSENVPAIIERLDYMLEVYSVEKLKGKKLSDFEETLNTLLEALRGQVRRTDHGLISDFFNRLGNERIVYYEALKQRMNDEADKTNKPEIRAQLNYGIQVVDESIRFLKRILDYNPSIYVEIRKGKPGLPSLSDKTPEAYSYWISKYRKVMREDSDSNLLSLSEGNKVMFLDEVKRIESYMRKRVVGQDEAIQSLMNLELELHVKGYNREKPAIRFLMGLPGTGKDTLAENYIDAKYNKKNAYEEHLFRLPPIRSTHDVWGIIGSGKGYVGSTGELTEFAKFLVLHSGGRYNFILDKDGKKIAAQENPNWKPGMVLPGFFAPEDGAIFVNEGHNISMQAFDILLKQAVEKGFFKINTSNGGVEQLVVPITIIFAGNHGISLLTSRDEKGRPIGRAKTEGELIETYNLVKNDRDLKREALLEFNGKSAGGNGEELGMSEEFVNRIPSENIIILKPLTREDLKKIIRIKMENLARSYAKSDSIFGTIDISITDGFVNFIQSYQYNAEEGARRIDSKIEAIMGIMYDAISKGELDKKGIKDFLFDVKENLDKTHSLVFRYAGHESRVILEKVIPMTEKDRLIEKPAYEEFDKLIQIPDELSRRIYGNPEATKGIGEAVAITQMARETYMRNRDQQKKATSFGLFGYAGLGKTQTAKELARVLTGTEEFMTVDFNYVNTLEKFEEVFVGSNRGGRIIRSQFAKEYDKKMGSTMIVLLEEVSNAHPEILKRLYPFFDEPIVRAFSDGKERAMSNVVFLATGNAGIEIYDSVMAMNLPRDVKMAALGWVYKSFINSPEARHEALKNKVPIPLLTRFTDIFHYRPINQEILRNLSQRFLADGIRSLKSKDGTVGWEVGFRSESDYYKMIEILENEGFEFENQGRSIFNYVQRNLSNSLKLLLARNHVPDHARIILVPRSSKADLQNGDISTPDTEERFVPVDVYVEGEREPLLFEMEKQKPKRHPKSSREAHIRTAVHEAGHNITNRLLFPDKMKTKFLSIVPGVTEIMNKYIYYLGVAESRHIESMEWTRQAVVQDISIKLAGAKAQQLVTKGKVDDAGKSNDIEQASYLAKRAIMQWGLSDRFHKSVDPSDTKALSLVSESDKQIISEEVDKLLVEGDQLAEQLLRSNFNILIDLANTLLEKGKMNEAELDKFYELHERGLTRLSDTRKASQKGIFSRIADKVSSLINERGSKIHNPEFIDGVKFTDHIIDIEGVIAQEKATELAKVPRPEIPLFTDFTTTRLLERPKDNATQRATDLADKNGDSSKPSAGLSRIPRDLEEADTVVDSEGREVLTLKKKSSESRVMSAVSCQAIFM